MRRSVTVSLAGVLAGVAWWAAAGPSAGSALSASVAKVGWWSQQPGAQPQPDGGFQVTNGPSGALSVAAIDVVIGDGTDISASLTLAEGSSVGSDRAGLIVCTTSSSWSAANPGAWGDQPSSDCSRAVTMTRDAASVSWKANISGFVHGGQTTSLMIVPAAQPVGGLVDPGWQVSITKASVTADGTTASDTFTTEPAFTETTTLGSSSGPSPSAAPLPSFTPDTAVQPAPLSTATPAAPPAAPPAAAAAPVPSEAFSGSGVVRRAGREHKPWGRLLVFVPIAAAVGLGAAAAKRQLAPAPSTS